MWSLGEGAVPQWPRGGGRRRRGVGAGAHQQRGRGPPHRRRGPPPAPPLGEARRLQQGGPITPGAVGGGVVKGPRTVGPKHQGESRPQSPAPGGHPKRAPRSILPSTVAPTLACVHSASAAPWDGTTPGGASVPAPLLLASSSPPPAPRLPAQNRKRDFPSFPPTYTREVAMPTLGHESTMRPAGEAGHPPGLCNAVCVWAHSQGLKKTVEPVQNLHSRSGLLGCWGGCRCHLPTLGLGVTVLPSLPPCGPSHCVPLPPQPPLPNPHPPCLRGQWQCMAHL